MKKITYNYWLVIITKIDSMQSIRDISKKANVGYVHTHNILHIFKAHGLVTFELVGRRKIVELTEKGIDLQYHASELMRISAFK